MKGVLALAAAAEAATGLAVLADPALVVRLLFGTEIGAAGLMVGRFAGIALIGLGIACWPGGSARQPHYGMLVYGALVTLYLGYVGLAGMAAGVLLWPAVAAHVLIVALLMWTLRRGAKHA
jgi:hypothetical protein